jgi:hypothetical protein
VHDEADAVDATENRTATVVTVASAAERTRDADKQRAEPIKRVSASAAGRL